MGATWTDDQKAAIDLQDSNLLVAAAAGSGKTAVLVERIIRMIIDRKVDVDKLLIVTFTNAAAAEMRGRIGDAIERALEKDPDNEHLQKQVSLIHSSYIMTIDGFCKSVIQDNFNNIDLDPSFRIGDEGELKLLRAEVLEEVLESHYAAKDEVFIDFAESYATGKTDEAIEGMILQLYNFSTSYPWPQKWLDNCASAYSVNSLEELEKTEWIQSLLVNINCLICDLVKIGEKALKIVIDPDDGPYMYEEAIRNDLSQLKHIAESTTYSEYNKRIASMEFMRLSSKKDAAVSEEKKQLVKDLRDEIKDGIKKIQGDYFFAKSEEILSDIINCRSAINTLVSLTKEFDEKFKEAKLKKNIVDFSDLEHYALNILCEENEEEIISTDVAKQFMEQFEEIIIDEYQDSNMVQEYILTSVSRCSMGHNNIFMVGDVKQSIYKFRLARPEIFMDKYDNYPLYGTDKQEKIEKYNQCQKIELHKNFRSRRQVLDATNYIFSQIMGRDLGNVEYDENAALYLGANFVKDMDKPENQGKEPTFLGAEVPKGFDESQYDAELIIIDEDSINSTVSDESKGKKKENSDSNADITKIELEARAIAERIKILVYGKEFEDLSKEPNIAQQVVEDGDRKKIKPLQVVDKAKDKDGKEIIIYRKCEFKDIAILLRTVSGWAEDFMKVLQEEGIPVHASSQTGYFSTFEITIILNYLRIIDNPYQDIPLTSILTSPIYNLKSEDMAKIKISKIASMYEACKDYLANGSDEVVKGKLKIFFEQLNEFRRVAEYTEVHKIIWKILDDTGFENIISVMPGGEQRSANVDILLEKALAFEKTSYKGLFNFVRYIESLHKAEIDYGEAEVTSGNENAVKIMSIHKSKGLEFPVVFVSGMGKLFNEMDARATVVMHPDMGIGTDYVDYEKRTKRTTIVKKILQNQIVLENKGEELRVLYVAMTRAKEKLIMTGAMSNIPKKLYEMTQLCDYDEQMLMYNTRKSARNYLSWVTNALARNKAMTEIYDKYSVDNESKEKECDKKLQSNVLNPFFESQANIKVSVYGLADLKQDEMEKQIEELQVQEELRKYLAADKVDEAVKNKVRERLNWDYNYKDELTLHTKVSVSEVKIAALNEIDKEAEEMFKANERVKPVPKFIEDKAEMSGASRGTAYHKILELMSFKSMINSQNLYEDIRQQIDTMLENKRIDEDMKNAVRIKSLVAFFESNLGKRMIKADCDNRLFLEKQFVMGMPAKDIYPESNSDEIILMQGIIDAFFEENGKYILMDYKTDSVLDENELVRRYKKQLELYKKAISQIYNATVSEVIIYSFSLNKEIAVKV